MLLSDMTLHMYLCLIFNIMISTVYAIFFFFCQIKYMYEKKDEMLESLKVNEAVFFNYYY